MVDNAVVNEVPHSSQNRAHCDADTWNIFAATLRHTADKTSLPLDFHADNLGIASWSPNLAARDIEPRILQGSDSLMTNENADDYNSHPENVKAQNRRAENP